MKRTLILCALFLLVLRADNAAGQLSKNSTWVKKVQDRYTVHANILYSGVDTTFNRLDFYQPKNAAGRVPVFMWIHGGGWNHGSKDSVSSQFLPFLVRGWAVVNVEYRMTPTAAAPAAVQDCRAALRWVHANAGCFGLDTARIVVGGSSSGGHLALMTGMLPANIQYDTIGGRGGAMNVAAIIDFYGITDVNDLLAANRKGYAVRWVPEGPAREELARSVSPLTYVRPGVPPVLAIQGNEDPTVPYSHSVRLVEALTKAGVRAELMTIPGGKHGKFTKEENEQIRAKMIEFLASLKLVDPEGK